MPVIEEKITKEIIKLQERMGYRFKDDSILIKSLTHRSYYTNNPTPAKRRHNERLEFLGDSVLGLVVSEYLFSEFPKLREGPLTKMKSFIVSKRQLYEIGKKLRVEKAMLLSTEERARTKKYISVIADCVEALIAAIYLDGGIEAAKSFILGSMAPMLDDIDIEDLVFDDFKSVVQQMVQKEYQALPDYQVLRAKGPEHSKTFIVQLSIKGEVISRGSGSSKKQAEQRAAQKAYKILRKRFKKLWKMRTYLDRFKKSVK
ncbi:MAG: ribonuclease III [Acidobacteria bacterium]|nr:ribonuclease III [Acidobacteriota bacterium]